MMLPQRGENSKYHTIPLKRSGYFISFSHSIFVKLLHLFTFLKSLFPVHHPLGHSADSQSLVFMPFGVTGRLSCFICCPRQTALELFQAENMLLLSDWFKRPSVLCCWIYASIHSVEGIFDLDLFIYHASLLNL